MPAQKARILIVEDDVQIRLLLSTILEGAGYAVRPAADGFAALEEMRAETPEILLSDLYMPGMSGFELLPIVRHQFPQTQVVAMSSAFCNGDVPPNVVADAFYAKATGIVVLLQIIEAMASLHESRHGFPSRLRRRPPLKGLLRSYKFDEHDQTDHHTRRDETVNAIIRI